MAAFTKFLDGLFGGNSPGESLPTEYKAIGDLPFPQQTGRFPFVPSLESVLTNFASIAESSYKSNSAIFAAFQLWLQSFAIAELRTKNVDGVYVETRPLDLILNPNPFQTDKELFQQANLYARLTGNAYLIKKRRSDKTVEGIYAYSDGNIQPVSAGRKFISHYKYDDGAGFTANIPVEDVIHIRIGIDPLAPQLGYGWIRPLIQEISADTQGTRMLNALLMNDGSPRTVITTPIEQGVLPPTIIDQLKAEFKRMWGGRRFGEPAVISGGATITRVALDMQELDFSKLRYIPESRIGAVCNTPVELLGLAAGLENSTYSNKAEARLGWTENILVPEWIRFAGILTRGLRNDFAEDFTFEFDTSAVPSLEPRRTKETESVISLFEKGLLSKRQAQERLGIEPDEEEPEDDNGIQGV